MQSSYNSLWDSCTFLRNPYLSGLLLVFNFLSLFSAGICADCLLPWGVDASIPQSVPRSSTCSLDHLSEGTLTKTMQGLYYMPSEKKINFASGFKCKRELHWVMKPFLNGLIERRCKTYLETSDWRWTFVWMAEVNIWTFSNFLGKQHFTSCSHIYDVFH